MKRPTMLYKALLAQASLDLDLSVERDVATLQHRLEHEGLSFLTITLPKLSDALEQGLEHGRFTCPTDFSRHGSLPRFLGGFFNRVFERSGELRLDAPSDVIYYIRQICRFFKKLKIPCSASRESEAVERYKDVERELGRLTPQILRKDSILDRVSKVLWSQVFSEIDQLDIVCHHGPGVTADRYLSNERCRIKHWYTRSELSFPSDLHAYPNYGYAAEASGEGISSETGISYWDLRDEPGVRVVFVPKTQTAPRVIAIEPSSMQFIQQGLMDYIVPLIEGHSLTRNSIRFKDQSVNQRLAYLSSKDRSLSTLDLKDASDRVHFELVRRIFTGSGILNYLEDARSLHANLPDGSNVILNKFASMGSAICFPVEAMVFYTLIQSAFHTQDGRIPSSSSIKAYSRMIDVYGDDIIVPVNYTDTVVAYLESYGLRVNQMKSFRFSHFRESCGGDFYNGYSVKPVYARELPHSSSRQWQANHVLSWAATSDQFYLNGQWIIAQTIRDMLEDVLHIRIPRSTHKRAGLAFTSLIFDTSLRFNRSLHAYEQKRIVYIPLERKDTIDGDAVSCFNKWGQAQHRSSLHSQREPIRVSSRLWSLHDNDIFSSDVDSESFLAENVLGLHDDLDTTRSRSRGLPYVLSGTSREPYPFEFGREHTSGKAINFTASTKRGAFKSKRRWITIAS